MVSEIARHDSRPEGTVIANSIFDIVQIDPTKPDFYRYKCDKLIVSRGKFYYVYPVEVIESDEFQITDLLNKKLILLWK